MSGSLRKAIAPTRNAMVRRLNDAKQMLSQSTPADAQTCEDFLCRLTVAKSKLTTSIVSMEEIDQRWANLIDRCEDTAKLLEEKHYETVATDENDGYLYLVEQCRDVICDLEGRASRIEKRIAKMEIEAKQSESSGTPTNDKKHILRAKLPKMTLPTFGGKDSLEWNQFWTIFSANVDNQEITKGEKFAYLLTQLHGTALETVKGLSIGDANYDLANELLAKRFKRSKGSMVRLLYSQLKQLPCSNKSVTAIRQTYNDIEAILRQLEETGEDLDSNTALSVDILSKYSLSVIRELSQRYTVTDDSSVSEIREAIEKYVYDSEALAESVARLRSITASSEQKERTTPFDSDNRSFHPAPSSKPTSALTSLETKTYAPRSGPTTESPPGLCYFCEGKYFNSEFPIYPTADERITQLRKRKRCERCGRDQHSTKECKRQIRCIHCRTTNHYSALCKNKFPSPTSTFTATTKPKTKTITPKKSLEVNPPNDKPCDSSDRNVTILNVTERSVLQTARAIIVNPSNGKKQTARLIFDTASHRSYIQSSLALNLELESSESERLKVSIFGTKRTLTMNSSVVSFDVLQRDGSVKNMVAHTTPLITQCSVPPQTFSQSDQKLLHSMKDALAEDIDNSDSAIDILVGSDYFWEFVSGSRISTGSGLLLIHSTLGFLLAGRFRGVHNDSTEDDDETATMLCLTERKPITHYATALATTSPKSNSGCLDIDKFWQLERIGIYDNPAVSDDDEAVSQFNDSIYQKDGRYHVKWPWIEEQKTLLPVNYELSLGRLRSLMKRLKTDDSELLRKHQEVIESQCATGIIERVPDDELRKPQGTEHYLPHHPVVKQSSATTKVRIVYDASSKCRRHSVSLNECIYRGPVMLPHLCEVLIRFRCSPIVITADVEKAFLQMSLQKADRDVTRFLWIDNPDKLEIDNNVAVYRFCRVPFGVIASSFLLGATIQHHLDKFKDDQERKIPLHPKSLAVAAQRISRDIYVDNVTCGANSEVEAITMQQDMQTLFSAARMNLQEFCSNSDEVLRRVPPDKRTKCRIIKFLGVTWNSEHDTLQIIKRKLRQTSPTKRSMLQTIASIFDPLGLFQPATLSAKSTLQKLWELDLKWDDLVPNVLLEQWNEDLRQLDGIFDRPIPRFVGTIMDDQTYIIVFCDASARCSAAAVYLRVHNEKPDQPNGSVNLVFSKSRLSPKSKPITLPRLELLGVVIGVKAGEFVRNALGGLHTIPIYLFTDAKVVLHWLQTKKLLTRFVANRVNSIRSVPQVIFRHVPSEYNSADCCTRGQSADELQSNHQWWHGPAFLVQDMERWPTTKFDPISSETLFGILQASAAHQK